MPEPSGHPGSDPMTWDEIEYREISADWRHRDAMLWQTLAVSIAFSGFVFSSWWGSEIRLVRETHHVGRLDSCQLCPVTEDHEG